jgi:hypothetical protein
MPLMTAVTKSALMGSTWRKFMSTPAIVENRIMA